MKKIIAKVILVIVCVLAIGLSFWAGSYTNEQKYAKSRVQQCCEYISSAIDVVENGDLSENGIREVVISYVFAAHELCDAPDLSAQLNDLHLTLTYRADTYIGKEAELTNSLKDILKSLQNDE